MPSNLPNGASLDDVSPQNECPVCDGSGTVELMNGTTEDCEECNGTGIKQTPVPEPERDDL